MKIAHVIFAHTAPQQLERLVTRLQHDDAYIFIHIDKKADIIKFRHLDLLNRVSFISNRVDVHWGGFSQVQAAINAFKEVMATGINFDYLNVMSGLDYPIKSTTYIHDFLSENPGKIFMHCVPVMEQWHEAETRITGYHLANVNFPGKYKAERMLNTLLPARRLPNGMVAAGRSQWFTASGDSIAYLLDYILRNAWISRFFKLSWGADELMFHTILYNSQFKKDITSDNLMHTDWSNGGPSPKTFTLNDLEQLQYTDKLFARKFDESHSAELLDALDTIHATARKISLAPYLQLKAV